jgi:hypothetical protein
LTLGDAFEEALEKQLPELASQIELSPKVARVVQRAINKGSDKPITKDDVETYLAVAAPRIFSKQRSFLDGQQRALGAIEGGGSYRMYLTKVSHAFMARSSTALCTTCDTWSWKNPNFLQLIMVDHKAGRVVGNIQLHITQDIEGSKAVLARVNPTEAFVDKVDKAALAKAMLSVVLQFADDNGLKAFLAQQGEYRMLTNRNSFLPYLEAYFGPCQEVETQVSGQTFQNVKAMYPIKREGLWLSDQK